VITRRTSVPGTTFFIEKLFYAEGCGAKKKTRRGMGHIEGINFSLTYLKHGPRRGFMFYVWTE
jgi:hypothetical protein